MMDAHTALATIERLAGPATFERGMALYNDHAILSYQKNRQTIKASVQSASSPGVKAYQVVLTIKASSYDGGCDCPASEGFDFCKHCVAVALQHADKLAQLEAAQGGSALERIQALLEDMDENQAKAALLALIAQDESSILMWRLRADIRQEFGVFDAANSCYVSVTEQTIKQTKRSVITELKGIINKALPLRDVWQYNKVRAYFEQAQEKLSLVIELLTHLPPEQAHALAWQMLKRYDKIFERVDDSGGFRYELANNMLVAFANSVQRLTWSTTTKAQYLLSLYETELEITEFTDIPQRFIAPHDSALSEAFYLLLEENITALNEGMNSNLTTRIKIQDLCAYYAEQSAFIKAIALCQPIAQSSEDYLQLAKWAIAAGDASLALAFVQQTQAADIYQKLTTECLALEVQIARLDNDPAGAIQLQWQTYTHSLLLDDFIQLNVLIANTDKAKWQAKAIAFWDDLLATAPTQRAEPYRLVTAEPLVELCLYLGLIERAVALVQEYPTDREVLYQVATMSVKYAPEHTFELYRRLILIWIKSAKSTDYKTIINLLLELQSLISQLPMPSPQNNAEQALDFFINEIAYEFSQKRQLQSMIKRHFVV